MGMISMALRVVVLAVAIAAVSDASVSAAEAPPRHITVTGEGTVSVVPDMAQLRAGVTTEGKTAREAGEANSKAMAAVLAAAKELGIAEKDIRTSRYAIQPVFDQGRPARERITGFRAVNTALLKIRDLDRSGDIIDRLTGAGANTTGGIDFLVSDPSKALDAARKEAIADAQRKADVYARAAGVAVGRPTSIVEQSASVPGPYPVALRAGAPTETPVAAGEVSLRVSVTVSFDLQR
jgi:uncharacterized protein YggE